MMNGKSYRRVVIESPFHGDISRNKRYLDAAIRDCIANHQDAPFASHGLYTRSLDDNDIDERSMGITAGFSWMGVCDAVVVYWDFGISTGMRLGMNNAKKMGIPVEMRKLPYDLLKLVKGE